jgi:hypothetical protein
MIGYFKFKISGAVFLFVEKHLLPLIMKNLTASFLFTLLLAGTAAAQTTIAAGSAGKHMGETVTICEKVFSGKRIDATKTTLLDVGGYYPKQPLVVVIPGRDRNKFKGNPEVDYDGKDITVTGKVIMYNGKPGILVQDPRRLKLVMIDNDRISRPTPVNKQ